MSLAVQPMLFRRLLRLAVIKKLQDVLDPSMTIMSPGLWPIPPEKLPAVVVSMPNEQKQSKGRNVPTFDTTCTVLVEVRISAATPELAQDAIEDLAYQIEEAILEGYWINRVVQQFVSVTTDAEIGMEGKLPIGGFKMAIVCETFEAFDPTEVVPDGTTWPLSDPVSGALQGIDLHVDMASPFDAAGTYPPGEFASSVPPAPRTTGPDGRDEGALQINLPQ